MTIEWWFAYLLTSIILSLSPGSGAINTMTTSINHGYRGAAASIAGLQTGLVIHILDKSMPDSISLSIFSMTRRLY